ncbi:MAG TPA: DNA-binding response regulator [Desulfotomaculum sp.]|nr:MAG: Two component transcriptional regulator, LuxR family [Desulfotomaculum sp. 46_80]HAG11303.1 DNA-binding response regulator [Desulfotomaculum sp.]HBY03549.1 DNA-binding response regulator [Desulfotomaculum sp.]
MIPIKLMIVDDHAMIRVGLATMLSDCKDISIIGSCSSSQEAEQMLLNQNADVILMDIKMPDISGIEAAKEILRKKSLIKIVFLTVFEDAEFVRLALQSGANGYILKHVSRDKLIETIKRVHQGETVIDPAVLHQIINDYAKTPGNNEQNSAHQRAELTPREHEILQYLTRGLTNKEISTETHLAVDTVKTHLHNIFRKLGVKNRAQAIAQISKTKDNQAVNGSL